MTKTEKNLENKVKEIKGAAQICHTNVLEIIHHPQYARYTRETLNTIIKLCDEILGPGVVGEGKAKSKKEE